MILHHCVTTQGHMSHKAAERASAPLSLYSQEVGRGRQGPGMLLSSGERDTSSEDLPEKRKRERLTHAQIFPEGLILI